MTSFSMDFIDELPELEVAPDDEDFWDNEPDIISKFDDIVEKLPYDELKKFASDVFRHGHYRMLNNDGYNTMSSSAMCLPCDVFKRDDVNAFKLHIHVHYGLYMGKLMECNVQYQSYDDGGIINYIAKYSSHKILKYVAKFIPRYDLAYELQYLRFMEQTCWNNQHDKLFINRMCKALDLFKDPTLIIDLIPAECTDWMCSVEPMIKMFVTQRVNSTTRYECANSESLPEYTKYINEKMNTLTYHLAKIFINQGIQYTGNVEEVKLMITFAEHYR